MFRNIRYTHILLVFSLYILVLSSGLAQTTASKQAPKRARQPHITTLQQEPVFPLIPSYQGKKSFVSGFTTSQSNDRAYTTTFLVGDEPDTVIDWYENALKQNGWIVQPRIMTGEHKQTRVTAQLPTKDPNEGGIKCVVSAVKLPERVFKSRLFIRYFDNTGQPKQKTPTHLVDKSKNKASQNSNHH